MVLGPHLVCGTKKPTTWGWCCPSTGDTAHDAHVLPDILYRRNYDITLDAIGGTRVLDKVQWFGIAIVGIQPQFPLEDFNYVFFLAAGYSGTVTLESICCTFC